MKEERESKNHREQYVIWIFKANRRHKENDHRRVTNESLGVVRKIGITIIVIEYATWDFQSWRVEMAYAKCIRPFNWKVACSLAQIHYCSFMAYQDNYTIILYIQTLLFKPRRISLLSTRKPEKPNFAITCHFWASNTPKVLLKYNISSQESQKPFFTKIQEPFRCDLISISSLMSNARTRRYPNRWHYSLQTRTILTCLLPLN